MQFIAQSDIPEPLISAEETWAAQADLAKLLKQKERRKRDPIYSYNDKYGFGPCLHHFALTPKLLRNKIDEARSIHEKHDFTKTKKTGGRRRSNNDKTSQDVSLRSSIPKMNKINQSRVR